MPLRKRKSFLIQVISSKLFIVTSLAILIFLGVSLSKEIVRRLEISQRIQNLKSEINEVEEKNIELSDLIDYLESESFRERELRLKLGMRKEGEEVIILPKNLNTNGEEEGEATPEEVLKNVNQSFPQKWWDYFFKK